MTPTDRAANPRDIGPCGAVTAIIPTFNRRDLVVEAARSVLGQTYPEVECLIVDNGSTDGTAEALRALGSPRLKVVTSDRPLGAARARNLGIKEANTSWVAFLDNDDLWAPTKIELQLRALAMYPSAGWCASACAYVLEDLTVRPGGRLTNGPLQPEEGQLINSEELLGLLASDNLIPGGGSCVLVSRDLALDVGGFNDDVPGCEDWDMWVRLAQLSAFVYVDRPLAAWRMWQGQGSTNAEMMLRSANRVRAKYFPDLGPFDSQYGDVWLAGAARRHLASKHRALASKEFAQLAWARKAPGQLAYALAALAVPTLAERRLQRIEPPADPQWVALAGPWLATIPSGIEHSSAAPSGRPKVSSPGTDQVPHTVAEGTPP
jgi:glycosyltransferase involved in cell wall biosynthesis